FDARSHNLAFLGSLQEVRNKSGMITSPSRASGAMHLVFARLVRQRFQPDLSCERFKLGIFVNQDRVMAARIGSDDGISERNPVVSFQTARYQENGLAHFI